jgi:four helix bundle protein
MVIHSFKDLIVWQKSIDLTLEVYKLTSKFPKEEVFGLSSQIKRAAISIPSNIAEGRFRGTRKDFSHFIKIAYGSGAELETQLHIAKKLSFGTELDYNKVELLLSEVMKMLNVMDQKLKAGS